MAARIQGIIFDLDGTLADTLLDITHATNAAMEWAGLRACTTEQVRRHLGSGVDVLVERASGEEDAQRRDEMVRVLRDHYAAHALDHTVPYPGIPALLDELRARGVPMCVLSNKPHVYTVMTTDALFGKWDFVQVRGEEPGVPRKPDPTTLLEMIERMELTASGAAMVGDSEVDVQTGLNAGVRTVGVTWGFRDRQDLLTAGAGHIIDTPEDLLALIQ